MFLWSPAEPRVQTEVVAVEAAKPAVALATLYEATSRVPGQQLLSFGASEEPAPVEGDGRRRGA